MSDESDYYESDGTDQVLAIDDHIFPMEEPYWCADYEFSKSHDDELWDEDELWLSAASWATVADRGEIELSSLSSSSPPVVPVSNTTILPPHWGDASICWHSALKECWTKAKLLPAQEELARDAAGSTSLEHMSQGSVPGQAIDSIPLLPPYDPGDILPSLCDLELSDRGRFPAARTCCTHSHCEVESFT